MGVFKEFLSRQISLTTFDLCNINSLEDTYTAVTEDGFYLSAYQIEGAKSFMGDDGHEAYINQSEKRLTTLLGQPGRQIQIVFLNGDEEFAKHELSNALKPRRKAAKTLRMEGMDELIDEQENAMRPHVGYERAYLVVSTSLAALNKHEQKKIIGAREKANNIISTGEFSQAPKKAYPKLRGAHDSFCSKLVSALEATVLINKLSISNLCRDLDIQITLNPKSNFKLQTIDDARKGVAPPRMQAKKSVPSDTSMINTPAIPFQLFRESPKDVLEDGTLLRYSSKVFAPMQVECWQQTPTSFSEFFSSVDRTIPYRLSFTFQTGQAAIKAWIRSRYRLVRLARLFNSDTQAQVSAGKLLYDFTHPQNGKEMTAMKGHFSICTWGNNVEEAQYRKRIIYDALQTWGGILPTEYPDDPVKLWIETMPGLSRKPVSIPSAVPLQNALAILPVTRPASFYKSGSMVMLGDGGKILNFEMAAEEQLTWNNILSASPGSGKSVLLMALIEALGLKVGNSILPRTVILDIGHNSKGLIDMFAETLPKDLKDTVRHFHWQNDSRFRVNPFDIMLGNRYPTSVEYDSLMDLLTMVFTPAGLNAVPHLDIALTTLIKSLYDKYGDPQRAKIYTDGVVPEIDRLIRNKTLTLHEDPTWYEITDELAYKEMFDLARKAQAQAVPALPDIAKELSENEEVRRTLSTFEGAPGTKSMIDFLSAYVQNAQESLELICGPTTFDTGGARFMAFNLADVIPAGKSADAVRKRSIMYMVGRIAGCREFFINEETLRSDAMNKDSFYRRYHERRIKLEMQTPKHIVYEEFHVTSGAPQIRGQVVRDQLTGRKHRVVTTLVSQSENHFDDDMIDNATNIFLLKADDPEVMKERQKKHGFSDDVLNRALETMTGPGTLMHISKMKKQTCIHIVRNIMGPMNLWSYSSTVADNALRAALVSRVGLLKTLRLLSKHFPKGQLEEGAEKMFKEFLVNTYKEKGQEMADEWATHFANHLLDENWKPEFLN